MAATAINARFIEDLLWLGLDEPSPLKSPHDALFRALDVRNRTGHRVGRKHPPAGAHGGHRAVSSADRAPRLHRGCRLCLLKIPNRWKTIEISASAPYRRGHDHDSFCPPDLIVGADVLFAPGPPQVLEPAPPV